METRDENACINMEKEHLCPEELVRLTQGSNMKSEEKGRSLQADKTQLFIKCQCKQ